MNAITRFVAVVFGPYPRNANGLSAPGDADCRWRAARREHRNTIDDVAAGSGKRRAPMRAQAGSSIEPIQAAPGTER